MLNSIEQLPLEQARTKLHRWLSIWISSASHKINHHLLQTSRAAVVVLEVSNEAVDNQIKP
jgi:hypothetical protein